jgi:hypothetical protein
MAHTHSNMAPYLDIIGRGKKHEHIRCATHVVRSQIAKAGVLASRFAGQMYTDTDSMHHVARTPGSRDCRQQDIVAAAGTRAVGICQQYVSLRSSQASTGCSSPAM